MPRQHSDNAPKIREALAAGALLTLVGTPAPACTNELPREEGLTGGRRKPWQMFEQRPPGGVANLAGSGSQRPSAGFSR